ncbi:MAG: hypothetical protein HDT39_07270 [Lachnospiraceae bacterium]|nr:hypothetical protein [Lachnospiraceae bacterium]
MNYMWDTLILAKRKNIDIENIYFRLAEIYSPYLELAMKYINFSIDENTTELDVNPFYRFGYIFNRMFMPDDDESQELREELLNCMLHFIYNIDIYTGMNTHEFMRMFIRSDIENGYFGEEMKESWSLFSLTEQEVVTTQMIDMYKTGSGAEVLRKAILGVFNNGYVYFNKILKDEILIFAGIREKDIYRRKMEFLIEMFMPLDFKYRIYWSKHFGIIGSEELMKEDAIVLY